jgi:hypothetical protein
MRVAEKLDWKGLKIKKSVGNRKIKIFGPSPTYDLKGLILKILPSATMCIYTQAEHEVKRTPLCGC